MTEKTIELTKERLNGDSVNVENLKHMTGIAYADLDLETASVVAGGVLMAKLLKARLQNLQVGQGTFFGPFERRESAHIAQRRVGPIGRGLGWKAPGKTVNGRSNPPHAADIVEVTKATMPATLGLTVPEYETLTGEQFKPGWFLRVTRVY